MASTIRSLNIVVGALHVPVALRKASERKEVGLSKALVKCNADGEIIEAKKVVQVKVAADTNGEAERIPVAEIVSKGAPQQAAPVIVEVADEFALRRGVWEGDQFFPIDDAQIGEIEAACAKPDMEIEHFVDLASVPWERVTGGYYLVPQKSSSAAKALKILHDALAATGKAGVTYLMPKSRPALALVYARHGGVFVSTVAYAPEFKQVEEGAASLEGVAVNEQAVEMATQIIEAYSSDADVLDEFIDPVVELKGDLIERAKAGLSITGEKRDDAAAVSGDGDALMAQLRASVEKAQKAKPKKKAKPAAKASRATTARKGRAPSKA